MKILIRLPYRLSYDPIPSLISWSRVYGVELYFEFEKIDASLLQLSSSTLRLLLKFESKRYKSLHNKISLSGIDLSTYATSKEMSKEAQRTVDLCKALASEQLETDYFNADYYKSPLIYIKNHNNKHSSTILRRPTLVQSYAAIIGKVILDSVRNMSGKTTDSKSTRMRPKHGFSYIKEAFQRMKKAIPNHWSLAYRENEWETFKKLYHPKSHIEADPFVVAKDGTYTVFYEHMEKGGLGSIYCRTYAEGHWGKAVEVLKETFHLSFPFVFEYDGVYYMLPESAGAQELRLYRAVTFPLEWKFEKTVLEGVRIFDAIISPDRKLLFANLAFGGLTSFNDELFAFELTADQLLTIKPELPLKPIIADVRQARNGGEFLEEEDQLFRLAQLNAPYYGYGLRKMKVQTMNQEADMYSERVEEIFPNYDYRGMHTYNKVSGFEIIDILE